MKITKQEVYLFVFLTIFAILWVSLVTPFFENSVYFASLNPILQFFSFNVGFILMSIVLINVPFKILTTHKVNFFDMIRVGLSGWALFSFIFDLWQPPN